MRNLYLLFSCLGMLFAQTANAINTPAPDAPQGITLTFTTGPIFCSQPGFIAVSVSGGAAPYLLFWSNGLNSGAAVEVFNPGTYTVTVIDAAGATATGSATVLQEDTQPIKAKAVVQDALAYGQQGGKITLSPVCGGMPPYTFAWSNGNTTQNLNGLSAGIYSVTIYDSYGCSTTLSVPVSQPGPTGIKIDILDAPDLSCDTGCTTIVLNTQPGLSYTWNGPNGFTTNTTNPLICYPGIYTVTASNLIDGSSATKSILIASKENSSGGIVIQSSNPAFCTNNSSAACEQVCPGTTVTYTADPIANTCGPVDFKWSVYGAKEYEVSPDGSSVTVTWGAPGGGQLEVTASDAFYCYFPKKQCVNVQEEPVAQFGSTPAVASDGVLRVCKGQSVWFKNQSLHATRYEWQFGDDQSSVNAEDVAHTFSTPGQFQVAFIARSQCFCADTTWLDVEVLDTETPLVECISTICPGETITYSTPANCAPYNWTISPNGVVVAGGSTNDNTVSVQWTNGPDGVIELSAPNCGGACPEPALLRVPVLSGQAAIEGPARVCAGSEARYSIAAFDGTTYTWKITGTGSIAEGQGTREVTVRWGYASSTDHKLIVSYENCYLGCSGTDTLLVKVREPMVLSGALEACAGANALIQVVTPFNINSQWTAYGPDGLITWTSANANTWATPVFSGGPGTYRIVAIPTAAALSGTCSDSAEWKVQVAPQPARPTGITGPPVFCPGQTLSFQATGIAPQNQVQWQIKNSNGPPVEKTGNPVNADFSAGSPRWVVARQVSTDGLGCLSDTVRHMLQPLQPLPVSGAGDLCTGAVQLYSALEYPGLDYQWTLIPADAGVIHTGQGTHEVEVYWPRPGSYTLRLSVCGQETSLPVTVWPNPQAQPVSPPGVCAGDKVLATTATGNFAAYRWKAENGATLSQADSAKLSPGIYALVVTDDRGCAGTAEFTIQEYPRPNLTITTTDPTGFCNNSRIVTISALTTEDGDYQYEWFRDGAPLNVNQAVYSTNQYGYYTATATNQYGCTATDGPVHVFEYCGGVCHNPSHVLCPAGSVGIGIAPLAQCNQFQFQVIDNGNYAPGTANWHFGESGSTYLGNASADDPVFSFPNAGQYLVVLYAQLQNGATCVVIDSVKVEAAAQFEFARACPGDSSAFKDISTFLPQSGITAWSWNFGDPASGANGSSGRTPKHMYAAADQYNVRLTVTAQSGCTSTAVQILDVPIPPSPVFSPQTVLCAGGATPLGINETDDLASIRWTFGDPASGILDTAYGAEVYHRYDAAGQYTAVAKATNIAGCTAVISQNLDIVPNLLSGDISPAGATAVCDGQLVALSAPPVGTSYLWSTGETGPVVQVSATGVYSVTVTDASGCTYVPAPKAVDVLPVPAGTIKAYLFDENGQAVGVEPNSLSVCAGETVHLFTAQSASNSYQWSSGSTTTTQVFSEDRFNSLSVGTHIFTVTITNTTTGCTAITAPFPVLVHPVPEGFSASTDQECAGTTANIVYNGPQPPDWQLFWNNGETGPGFITSEPGHYYVRVVNSFGCAANSEKITIKPGPNIAALPSGCHKRCIPDTLCLPPMPEIATWQWFFNGAAIPDADGPNLVATESGVYWAEMTDTSGCFAQSTPLTLELYTGAGDIYGGVWSDVNNNGVVDAGDTLVSNIPVRLWQNGITVVAGQSGAGGTFVFNQVPSVNGFVTVDSSALPTGWEIVIGQSPADLFGCAATAQTQLLLHANNCLTTSGFLSVNVCAGTAYDYNGTLIPAGSSQEFILQNTAGCDSVLTVNVGVLPASAGTLNVSACAGTVYDYNGTLIPAGTSQEIILQNTAGCDSVLTVNVGALAASASTLNVSACAGTAYDYNGTLIPAGSSQEIMLQNAAGCDSVLTVNVGVLPASAGTLNVSACAGTVYDYNGTLIPAGSSQEIILQNTAGCDSVLTVQVSAAQPSSETLQVAVCPGEAYDYNGTLIPAGDSQEFLLQNAAGCDSTLLIAVSATTPVQAAVQTTPDCADIASGGMTIASINGGTSPLAFSLDAQNFQPEPFFDNLNSGAYTLWVRDAIGCRSEYPFVVDQQTAPTFELPQVIVLPCNQNTVVLQPVLTGDPTGLSYLWWNGATTPQTSVSDVGPVWLELTNVCATIRQNAQVSLEHGPDDGDLVYTPNAFMPGASEPGNGEFRPNFSADLQVLDYRLEVYDRWGSLVFRTLDMTAGWTGDTDGKVLDPGVYVWVLKVRGVSCGREVDIRKTGSVTVVR